MVKTKSVWTDITTDKKKEREEVRELPQVPGTRKSIARDMARSARLPGLRRSRKSGKKYWETRENRSDRRGTKL